MIADSIAKEKIMTTDLELEEIFRAVGDEHGFRRVESEFMPFKEFKVRWQRSHHWAEFKVSDYLEDAPSNVIDGLARSLFSKIVGTDDVGYSKDMHDWITSPEFSRNKQPTYIKRCRNLARTDEGSYRSLSESYSRLINLGIASIDPMIYLSWTKEGNMRGVGHCSVLMKVISISSALDTDMVPEFVLDYCLYREMCHMEIGFDPTQERHDKEYSKLLNRHPKKSEAEEWMRKLNMS